MDLPTKICKPHFYTPDLNVNLLYNFNTKFFVFRLIKAIFGYRIQKVIEVEIAETWFREEKQSKKFLPDDRK